MIKILLHTSQKLPFHYSMLFYYFIVMVKSRMTVNSLRI